jgi:hypothetical protein
LVSLGRAKRQEAMNPCDQYKTRPSRHEQHELTTSLHQRKAIKRRLQ